MTAPTITGISPRFFRADTGIAIRITGTGFSAATAVDFDGDPAAVFIVVSDTAIDATTPALAAGGYGVFVTNPDGSSPGVDGVSTVEAVALDDPPAGWPAWTQKVVTVEGTLHKSVPLLDIESITRTHNAPREAIVSFPRSSYTRDDIHIFAKDDGTGDLHEIQLIRNDVVRFWGPAVQAEGSSTDPAITMHCRDPLWYLTRRFLDAQRTNLLDNPSFETGDDTSWTSVGSLDTDEVTNADSVRGAYSLHLESSTPLGDIFKRQSVSVTGTGIGTFVTVVAYFKIIGSLTGHALDRRGLYVEARESGVFKTNNYYAIDEATDTGDWIRATTTIQVPPNTTWDLDVRLYSPPGEIRWDDTQEVAMQSISTASITGNTHTPVDLSALVELILDFVQDPSVGKSDLNIGLDNPTIGVKAVKHIQWADHIAWWDQMSEWLDRNDCFDISLRNTDATTRELVLYPGHQGTDRRGDFTIFFTDIPSEMGDRNVVSYTFTEDGGGVVTDDTELLQDTGDGPDREEGHYADASLVGGVTLQAVNAAPPRAEPASLNPIARDKVNQARRPAQLLTFTLKGEQIAPGTGQPWDELLGLGDICDFAVHNGWTTIDAAFGRISQIVEYPRTRKLEVTIATAF